jgi:hypothetical protein
VLPNGDISDQTGTQQHLVCWLKDALEVRRVSLRQRELLGQPLQGHAPGKPTIGTGDFEHAVQTPGDRGRQGVIARRRQGDRVTSGQIGAYGGGQGYTGVARLTGG